MLFPRARNRMGCFQAKRQLSRPHSGSPKKMVPDRLKLWTKMKMTG